MVILLLVKNYKNLFRISLEKYQNYVRFIKFDRVNIVGKDILKIYALDDTNYYEIFQSALYDKVNIPTIKTLLSFAKNEFIELAEIIGSTEINKKINIKILRAYVLLLNSYFYKFMIALKINKKLNYKLKYSF
jgi:hypothetical protein